MHCDWLKILYGAIAQSCRMRYASLTHHPKLAIAISPLFGQPIRERLFSATAIAP
ncbi:hypothetical protein [Nostoc sp. 'Peltigera membranacea cyanobiont' 213]|uniref:hypothetical protein n=1 Tax=Nostoc sp. 'Peltigera membranacea cyanobiont' 213 TaxID=2014530 RepID=UPI00167EE603|nr:hypothetical protein [Nostoc sp. 'Peltigera membranacea cyanobiont' 213]